MAALIKAPVVRGEAILPLGTRSAAQVASAPRAATAESAPTAPAREKAIDVPAVPRSGTDVPSDSAPGPAISVPPPESAEALRARLAREHGEALEAIRAEARRQGYDDGFAQGEAAARRNLDEAADALRGLVASTNASIAGAIAEAEEIVGAIVFEAVCKIAGEQLVTAEGARAVVAHLVSRARQDEVVAIRVNANDLAHLRGSAETDPILAGLTIEADPGVELGGCIVQLKGGHIDGRIETQFRAFAQSIKDAAIRPA